MGETTRFFRRWQNRKTTIAGLLFAVAVGLRHIPAAAMYSDGLEATAAILLGTVAADARKSEGQGA